MAVLTVLPRTPDSVEADRARGPIRPPEGGGHRRSHSPPPSGGGACGAGGGGPRTRSRPPGAPQAPAQPHLDASVFPTRRAVEGWCLVPGRLPSQGIDGLGGRRIDGSVPDSSRRSLTPQSPCRGRTSPFSQSSPFRGRCLRSRRRGPTDQKSSARSTASPRWRPGPTAAGGAAPPCAAEPRCVGLPDTPRCRPHTPLARAPSPCGPGRTH